MSNLQKLVALTATTKTTHLSFLGIYAQLA